MSVQGQGPPPEVRQALYELQRYLSDQVAPMMVVDSIELLLRCPPVVVAKEIEGWMLHQPAGAQAAGPSDYLFHALKKIHMMSEFDLMDAAAIKTFVGKLGEIVVEICPEEERETLRHSVSVLGESERVAPAAVTVLHRDPTKTPAGRAPDESPQGLAPEFARSLKRFSLFLHRLESRTASPGVAGTGGVPETVGQALAAAAVGSRSGVEFERHMHRLGEIGIQAGTDQVFRALGQNLPGWVLPAALAAGAAQAALPQSRQVEAMHRIITDADPEEGAKRFSEMLGAAIEQLNEGRLPQAARMVELAERIVAERRLDAHVVQSIQRRAHESLSDERLRQYADEPEKHELLRRVLDFFPARSPKGLLDALDGERRRERRKLLLALLEVHGQPARSAALDRLANVFATSGDPHGYFRRNLVFLLRRIPSVGGESPRREVDLLVNLAASGNPPLVVKEAISTLGQLKDPAAEQTLIERLSEYEAALAAGGPSDLGGAEEIQALLDRATASLAQHGTGRAIQAIVEHGLRKQPCLGDTMARLEKLGQRDLSEHRAILGRLLDALRAELPRKVLGFVVHRDEGCVGHLVHALAGTPAPEVRQLLEEIVRRFPEAAFREAASRALAGFGAKAKPEESATTNSLSGDVELFGLPSLFQTLSDSRLTGRLTLTDGDGAVTGTVTFEEGRICRCQTGRLTGEPAFYQLFVKPVPGSFAFRCHPASDGPSDGQAPIETMPAILEALRRHDEFELARSVVPDTAKLKATGAKPTCPEGTDLELLREVWVKASAGCKPSDCEAALAVDSYEIRRLYSHWLEEGVLELR